MLAYMMFFGCAVVFFFKQKTAYEMRISDWSSDVCSSDLLGAAVDQLADVIGRIRRTLGECTHFGGDDREALAGLTGAGRFDAGVEREKVGLDRKSVV